MSVSSDSPLKVLWNWVLAWDNVHAVKIWGSLCKKVFLWQNLQSPHSCFWTSAAVLMFGFLRGGEAESWWLTPRASTFRRGNRFRAGWSEDVCVCLLMHFFAVRSSLNFRPQEFHTWIILFCFIYSASHWVCVGGFMFRDGRVESRFCPTSMISFYSGAAVAVPEDFNMMQTFDN